MVDYREILRLHSLGNSQRSIAATVRSSRDTVADVLKAADAAGVSWPLADDVSNAEIQKILFPGKYAYASPHTMPEFQWIHSELAKKGVTLTLLWDEYCREVRKSGGVPYMYTQFCEKYRCWARVTKATMRITHKPGDAMQVDWAGDPLYITNPVTGERSPAHIFVAVLPCSWFTYAEVCDDMRMENWLLCHVHAYQYFGGVARLLIPDNCKTAIQTNNRYETILNQSYQELADRYKTAIVPARVRKPDDKAAVEGSVRFVSTWITAALRDRKFFSIDEAQEAVLEKLNLLNQRPFKKTRVGNRVTAYLQEEQPYMQPLPAFPYEPSIWLVTKVGYEEFTEWARKVGSKTEETVRHFLNDGREPEQGFKACASLTKLESRYGKECLEETCERVLRLTSAPSVRNIRALCQSSYANREEKKTSDSKNRGHGITSIESQY